MPGSWWSRLRIPWPWRTTVASALTDLGDLSDRRRSNAAIWVWSHGHDSFTADERHQLAGALRPVATADPDPATRAQAIAALVELRANGSVDLALAALRDPDWGIRMIVAGEMAPTGDQRIVDALVALLDDEDGFVRQAAAIGLEKQGDPRALEPLRAMVRREREDAAAKKNAKHAIRTLEKLLSPR